MWRSNLAGYRRDILGCQTYGRRMNSRNRNVFHNWVFIPTHIMAKLVRARKQSSRTHNNPATESALQVDHRRFSSPSGCRSRRSHPAPMTECTGGGRSRFPTPRPISYRVGAVAVDPTLSAAMRTCKWLKDALSADKCPCVRAREWINETASSADGCLHHACPEPTHSRPPRFSVCPGVWEMGRYPPLAPDGTGKALVQTPKPIARPMAALYSPYFQHLPRPTPRPES